MAIDVSVVGKPGPASTFDVTSKDTILYALGVGAKRDELELLYEGSGPKVLPSFAVVPKFLPTFEALASTGGNLAMSVHASEKVVIHRPFAPAGKLVSTATVRGVYDLGRTAQVLVDATIADGRGALVAEATTS